MLKKESASTWGRLQGSVVLRVVVIALTSLAFVPLLVIAGTWAYTGLRYEMSRVPSAGIDGSSLSLTGARDETVRFTLTGSSLQGYWASSGGLRLTLTAADGSSSRLLVLGPRDRKWRTTIGQAGTGSATKTFTIRAAFTVPDLPGPQKQQVTGRLTGVVYYPRESGSGRYFESHTVDVNVAVRLNLVKASDYSPPPGPGHAVVPWGVNGWVYVGVFIALLVFLVALVQEPKRT